MCGLHLCFAEIWLLLGCDAGLSGVLPAALKEHSAFSFAGWGGQKNAVYHCLAVALSRALTICHLLSGWLTGWCPVLSQQILLWHFLVPPPPHTHMSLLAITSLLPQLEQQTYMWPFPMYGIIFWTLNLWRWRHYYIPLRCCKTLS